MNENTEREFPTDWTEWSARWTQWRTAYGLKPSRSAIRGKNFLADDVLGTYEVRAGIVELSEVTFPGFGKEDRDRRFRYVGITWMGEHGKSINGGIVSTFAELESAITAGPPAE